MLRCTPKYPALFFALSSVSPSASACEQRGASLHHHCKRNQSCKPKSYEAKVRVGVLGLGLGLGLGLELGLRLGFGLGLGLGPGLCLSQRLLLRHVRLLGREGSGGAATPGAVRRRLGRARELAPRAITLGTVHPPRFGRYRGYRERASGLRADATGGWQAADFCSDFFGKGSLLRNEPQYPTKGYAPHSGRGGMLHTAAEDFL